MIDKENQTIQISLKDYEDLLELKWLYSHTTNNKDDFFNAFTNIIKNKVKYDEYYDRIEARNYGDDSKILNALMVHIKYTIPELYNHLIELAKENNETDDNGGDD